MGCRWETGATARRFRSSGGGTRTAVWAGGPVGPCWPGCQRRGVTRGRRVEGGAEVGSALRARLTACTPVLLAKIVTSHDRPAARRLTGRRPWRTRVRRTGNVRRQLAVPRARCQSRRPIGGEECTRVGVPHGDTAARRCRPVHRASRLAFVTASPRSVSVSRWTCLKTGRFPQDVCKRRGSHTRFSHARGLDRSQKATDS